MSQDHIKLYLSAIRQRGGWKNNPNTKELIWAFRQMLFSGRIAPSKNANAINVEHLWATIFKYRSIDRCLNEVCKENREEDINLQQFINYIQTTQLTDLHGVVLCYIAGFVVFKLSKLLTCLNSINIIIVVFISQLINLLRNL